ncbi:MAG: DUF1491 family protein [Neomegalonema sp.]|nr:DUF1491 family protein [Neomegalonema sp.]
MSAPRLTASLWISAHIRRCEIAGANASVTRRGDEQSGQILLCLRSAGEHPWMSLGRVLQRATLGDGAAGWTWLIGPQPQEWETVTAKLDRQIAFDPDLWVLEIDDPQGRHFLDDPVA